MILSGLEKAINFYLRLDPESALSLEKLNGKCIQLSITDWQTAFFILPQGDHIILSQEPHEADTVISGASFGLFKAGLAKGKGSALFENTIEISGDVAVGETLRHCLSAIDIDWEEHLSQLVGDVFAHQLFSRFKRTLAFGRKTLMTLQDNVKEFLHSESQQLPAPQEVEQFIEEVSQLQHAVDRTEARVQRLLAKRIVLP